MKTAVLKQFQQLLNHNVAQAEPVSLTPETAVKLISRIDQIKLHAHIYPFIHNLTHGTWTPRDVLIFAYEHELQGVNLHIHNGTHSLAKSSPATLAEIRALAQQLKLDIHLEISHTRPAEVDELVKIALALGSRYLRVYSRYEGYLQDVLTKTVADLRYMMAVADKYDLYFDFEQHEEVKSSEIVWLLEQVNHPRLKVLFDFSNMINAAERPLNALKTLAPYARQTHLKGAQIFADGDGYGQLGVPQGGTADDLPNARMLFELLLLGDLDPQIRCFILEQEVNYRSPAYRLAKEEKNPYIPPRQPGATPFDTINPLALLQERQWAVNQVTYVKGLLAEMRRLATLIID